jgi:UDP:flavonoid glycosyltransferase YjiC (YdhE family)
MRCKKFLLIPGNNAISHLVKCLAISEALMARGHEARVVVSRKHAPFLKRLKIDHIVLPDIQETDGSGFPSVEWFRHPQTILNCINAEVDLLKTYRPERVLGVFRFTLKASAQIARVPYDSLTCGCIIPDSSEVLGYAEGEPGREVQQIILDSFYRYAGAKIGDALTTFGLPKSNGDIRHMLKGERTFLWDFPEFTPVQRNKDIVYVGPLAWNHWPSDIFDFNSLIGKDRPLAVVTFGTCTVCVSAAKRIINVLIDRGYHVVLAAGGQKEFFNLMPGDPRVTTYMFAPLPTILPHTALLVTHGGQMTIFEALQNRVPVVVMPFQPEQAHNGVCLERLGCGTRLVSPQLFQGNSSIYNDALDRMTDAEIVFKISNLIQNTMTEERLAAVSKIIGNYNGSAKIADMLGET